MNKEGLYACGAEQKSAVNFGRQTPDLWRQALYVFCYSLSDSYIRGGPSNNDGIGESR